MAQVMVAMVAVAEAAVTKRLTGLAMLVVLPGLALAADPDLAFQTVARKNEVTPLCAGLLPRKDGLAAQQRYHKALCLLYGIGTEVRTDDAMDLLRALAAEDHGEAQLALADTLQEGTPLQQQESLHWYGRASAGGDIRATLRQARLQQRLQQPAPLGDDSGSEADAAAARQPGYHCHFYGFGKKVCHAGME